MLLQKSLIHYLHAFQKTSFSCAIDGSGFWIVMIGVFQIYFSISLVYEISLFRDRAVSRSDYAILDLCLDHGPDLCRGSPCEENLFCWEISYAVPWEEPLKGEVPQVVVLSAASSQSVANLEEALYLQAKLIVSRADMYHHIEKGRRDYRFSSETEQK